MARFEDYPHSPNFKLTLESRVEVVAAAYAVSDYHPEVTTLITFAAEITESIRQAAFENDVALDGWR